MERLNEKREHLWQQNRRTDRDRVMVQRRKKFLDLSDLLTEADTISNQMNTSGVPTAHIQRINELMYGEDYGLLEEGEDEIKATIVMSDSPCLADKCRCTDEIIAILKKESFVLSALGFKLILRACINLIMKQPQIDYQMASCLLQTFFSRVNLNITFNDTVSLVILSLLLRIPIDKRTDIFYQHRKLMHFIAQLLTNLSSTELINRYIFYVDTIFSGCDEDTRDLLLQNIPLIKAFVKSLSFNSELADSVLTALSNIALNGSEMVEFLLSINIVPILMNLFQNSKASTQHLIVVVFYNLVLSSTSEQIINLCQNGLLQIISYCLINPINLESLQLVLKLLQKVVKFIQKKYVRTGNEEDPKEVLRRLVNDRLKVLISHNNTFVKEISQDIYADLNKLRMQTE